MERKVVDFHAHAFADNIAEKAAQNLNTYYDIPLAGNGQFCYVKQSMIDNKIDKMVVHATATKASQVEHINDYVKSLTSDDIIGFGTIHFEYENITAEIDRIIKMGLRGMKFHPVFQGFNVDDKEMYPIYECLEGRLPVLMHMGDKNVDNATPKRLAKVMDDFPHLTVIAAHLGGVFEWENAEKYLLGRDNMYVDTSSAIRFLTPERSYELMKKQGMDKVLFGTDYPLSLHKEELDLIDKIPMTEEEKELVLWKNAYKLLELE
ncbi:MAG: amidohydrolase family protein [Clostridia bacterium]|nr:amidohydrolase family protein [Clostridia bacterium]